MAKTKVSKPTKKVAKKVAPKKVSTQEPKVDETLNQFLKEAEKLHDTVAKFNDKHVEYIKKNGFHTFLSTGSTDGQLTTGIHTRESAIEISILLLSKTLN